MTPILHSLFQKIEAEETLYEASITLRPKPSKTVMRRELYRPISLMNKDIKILNKILANWIQQCRKRIIQHDQVAFISGMQCRFSIWKSLSIIYHMNKLKKENHMIISVYAENAFDRIQYSFMMTALNKN